MPSPIIIPSANPDLTTTHTGETTGYGFTRFIKLGGNLYFNTDTGIWRKSEPLDTPVSGEVLMLPLVVEVNNSSGSNVVADGKFTGYKAVLGIRDAKDNVHLGLTSAPTIHTWADNFTPMVDVHLPGGVTTDYFVQIYRTNTFDTEAAVDENYYLAAERVIESSEITQGYVTFEDRTVEGVLGASLYTNPDVEGILGENYRPGLVKDMAVFNNRAFYANYRGRYAAFFSPVSATTTSTEIGLYTHEIQPGSDLQVTTSLANGVITFNSAHGLDIKDGSMIYWLNSDDELIFPLGTTVVSHNTTTITCSNNALIALSAASTDAQMENAFISDYLQINNGVIIFGQENVEDVESFFIGEESDVYYYFVRCLGDEDTTAELNDLVDRIVRVWSVSRDPEDVPGPMMRISVNEIGLRNILLLQHEPTYGYTLPTLDTNNTLAWSPDILQEGFIVEDKEEHRLLFSKLGQAESVPITNSLYIGSKNFPIYRVVALDEVLLVFKQDGLYAVTGYSPETFSVRVIDPQLTLTHWNSVASLHNLCIAVTNRGLVAINGFDVQVIGQDIYERMVELTDDFKLESIDEQYWTNAEIAPTTSTYILSLARSATERARVFAYDMQHGHWSEWYSHAASGIFRSNISQYDNKMRFVPSVGDPAVSANILPCAALFELRYDQHNDSVLVNVETATSAIDYDNDDITPDSLYLPVYDPTEITVPRTEATYLPTVTGDDLVFEEDITEANLAEVDQLLAKYPIPVLLVWAPFTADAPNDNKHFDRASFSYRGITNTEYQVFFSTDFSKDGNFWPTLDLPNSRTITRTATDIRYADAHHVLVPRACRRGTRLLVGVYYNELHKTFILETTAIDYLPMLEGGVKRNV